jgi:hypothetical protein
MFDGYARGGEGSDSEDVGVAVRIGVICRARFSDVEGT